MSEQQSRFLVDDKLKAIVVKPSNQGYRKDESSPWMPKSYLLMTPPPENWKVYVTTASIKNLDQINLNNKESSQVFQLSKRQVALLQFFTGDKAPWQTRTTTARPKGEKPAKLPKPEIDYMGVYREAFDAMVEVFSDVCTRKGKIYGPTEKKPKEYERKEIKTDKMPVYPTYSAMVMGFAPRSNSWEWLKKFILTLPRGSAGVGTGPNRAWFNPAVMLSCMDIDDPNVKQDYLAAFIKTLKAKKGEKIPGTNMVKKGDVLPGSEILYIEVWEYIPPYEKGGSKVKESNNLVYSSKQ